MPRKGVFRKGWFKHHRRAVPTTGVQSFAGAGAFTVGPATLSGAATFTAPTYSGAAALTVGPATLASAGTFQAVSAVYPRRRTAGKRWKQFNTRSVRWWAVRLRKERRRPPVYSSSAQAFVGTAAWSVGAATLSGSAAFVVPTYTGTADLTVGAAVLSGSAVGPPPPPPPVGRSIVFGLFRRKKKKKDEPAVVPSNLLDPKRKIEWDDDEVLMAAEIARRYWNGGGF